MIEAFTRHRAGSSHGIEEYPNIKYLSLGGL
jgi:hypothetical protein